MQPPWISPPNFPATAFGVSKIRAKNKENKTLRFEETPKFIDILAGRRDEKEQWESRYLYLHYFIPIVYLMAQRDPFHVLIKRNKIVYLQFIIIFAILT